MEHTTDPLDHDTDAKETLRERAEARVKSSEAAGSVELGDAQQVRALVHELRVHQLELEMQNDELRRAQLALEASRARYFGLYDLAPVGYVTLSDKGIVTEANLRASEILGIPRAELINHPISRCIAPIDEAKYYHWRNQMLQTGENEACELRTKRPDGTEHWIQLNGTLMPQGERVRRCLTTISDITETHMLHVGLARADRMSSMGLLAAGVAHEINNPLTFALYNIEALAEGLPLLAEAAAGLSTELRAAVSRDVVERVMRPARGLMDPLVLSDLANLASHALDGIRRIHEISRGLGAYSRVDAQTLTRFDPNRAVEQAITMVSHEIRSRAVLVKELRTVPPVLASEGRLAQVVVNLLVNAAHAIAEEHVSSNQVSVRTWSEDGSVVIEVSDTGCGIAAENLSQIFEPFFTTKSPERGTGLGLSICQGIVHEIGGELEIDSVVGQGTRVVVRLPIAPAEVIARVPEASEPELDRGRILVVDDEEMVRNTVRSILKKQNEVMLVDSGRAAQALLSADTDFDVIICDLMMGDVSGVELHRWLLQHHPRLAERVVFITGGVFTPSVSDYLAKVPNSCIDKPFNTKELRRRVAELVHIHCASLVSRPG